MSETVVQTTWVARNAGRIAALSFAVAAIGAFVAMLSGAGYQRQLWPTITAFAILRWGVYIAATGGVLSLIALFLSAFAFKGEFLKRSTLAILGVVVGAIAFYLPYSQQQLGQSVPPIHDITTDTDNPPLFVDIVALREATKARNPAEYIRERETPRGVMNIPELQKKGYPDLQPIVWTDVPPAEAFNRAYEAAKKQGWTMVAAKADEGRIEAWDKTPWFGFIDDVVIRVAPEGAGSRIDVRSKSRVGGSDIGKNAQRIRAYVKTLTTDRK